MKAATGNERGKHSYTAFANEVIDQKTQEWQLTTVH